MKARTFFIGLFTITLLISIGYTLHFFDLHYTIVHQHMQFVLFLVGAVALQMFANLIRAYKSRLLLERIRETKTSTLFRGLSIGYLFNSLLPLRLGEFIRAYYVGDTLAISKTTVFMSIVIERLIDGIILGLAFIGVGLYIRGGSYHSFVLLTKVGAGLLIASFILAIIIAIIRSENKWLLRTIHGLSRLFNTKISSRLQLMGWSAIYGTRLMLTSKRSLIRYLILSIFMWLSYLGSTTLIVLAYFRRQSITHVVYAAHSPYAGVSTPVGPGYLDTFHLIVSRLLQTIGITGATNFTVVVWLILTVPISFIGILVVISQRFNQQREVSHQDALINKLYREKDVSNEFSNFLNAYFKGEEINRVLTQAELDGKFKLVKSFKGGSNAHTMLVWQDGQLVVKKITLPEYADKLKDQAQWLSSRAQLPHLPQVISQEKTDTYYTFDLEYKADYLPMFDYIHSHATDDNFTVLKDMLSFMNKQIYQPTKTLGAKENLNKYIEGKILGKINDTAAVSKDIDQLLLQPKLIINGASYHNLLQIVAKIRANKKAMADLASYQESPIHGDLTIDNLIASGTGDFLVIDPNNENQVSAPVVDYGKLYQSLHSGYEFLIQLETCQLSDNVINFEDSKSQKYAELFQRIDTYVRESADASEYRSILFHEGVHYCRMLTYRANINPNTLPVFYATAVKLFNEFLAQYE